MGHILDWRTFMQDNIFYRITVGWVRFDLKKKRHWQIATCRFTSDFNQSATDQPVKNKPVANKPTKK
ncbi:hypothetical protein AU253_01340 [Yersinia pestis]|nr:hypothetical protein AU253_01340 [Yersinia pestis]